MPKRPWIWLVTGLLALAGYWALRRQALTRPEPPSDRVQRLFWQAEASGSLSSSDRATLGTLLPTIDPQSPEYPLAVALLLLYGETGEAPPMVYVQRLRQLEDPCAKAVLGRLAWHTGQKEKAFDYWRQAEGCSYTYLFLASAYLQLGSSDSACAVLRGNVPSDKVYSAFHRALQQKITCLDE